MRSTATSQEESLASLVGQVAEEFIERLRHGERPDVEEYAKRHPEIAAAIRQVFPALELMRVAGSDSNHKQNQSEKSNVSTIPGRGPKMSNAQKRAILNLAQRRGITENELIGMVEEAFNSNLDYLSSGEASSFIRQLQQAA